MKLIGLRLKNFRPFYGTTPELKLGGAAGRNITVIHGNNGSGKTALLNAFTWALYESFTAALASPEQLVNQRAIAEAGVNQLVECWVEVMFEHEGRKYRVRRVCRATQNANGEVTHSKSELQLQTCGDDGRWQFMLSNQTPEDAITRILPKSLHQYFFFDGERIERIVRSQNRAEIAEATKKLIGREVLEKSILHLKNARKTLEQELERIGDAETKKFLAQKTELEAKRDRLLERQDEIETELAHHADRQNTLREQLQELSGAEQLQLRRQELKASLAEHRELLAQSKEVLKKAISTRGYTVFLGEATAAFRQMVEGLRQRGELPADVKQQFVQDLLDRNYCICGTELHEGSPERKKVGAWLEKAGLADVEEQVFKLASEVDRIDRQAEEFWEEVDREQANVSRFRDVIGRVQTELEGIDEQLRQFPREDVRQLQARLDELEDKVNDLTLEKGGNQFKVAELDERIQALGKRIREHKKMEKDQRLAQKRIDAAEDAIARLVETQNNLDRMFRVQLERRIQEIFGQISFKSQVPRLSEKYELTLVDTVAGQEVPAGASTGENQILSLAFIGAVIDRVREWSRNRSNLLVAPESGTFPVVMDSPFGTLDELYRRQVARLIPKLANQVVVLASKTQWRGEVEKEMEKQIAREYVLSFNSTKQDGERDEIERQGESYPLVRSSPNEFEYTEIVEVNRNG
ncbi:MAG: AAA family ATPase [Synechococcus sp.]